MKLGKESKNNPKPNNANTPLNGCSKSGEKKTKSAKQDNKVNSILSTSTLKTWYPSSHQSCINYNHEYIQYIQVDKWTEECDA